MIDLSALVSLKVNTKIPLSGDYSSAQNITKNEKSKLLTRGIQSMIKILIQLFIVHSLLV